MTLTPQILRQIYATTCSMVQKYGPSCMVADMNILVAFHTRCQRQILDVHWRAHDIVSNAEVLWRSDVTSYVIDVYLFLVTLHVWTLEYQRMILCF